jgi:transposase-like protein
MSTRKHAVSEERKAEVVAEVLGRMADGQTVKEAVSAMQLDVSDGTVRRWMTEREEWAGDYQRAKKLMASAMAEEALRVARESTNYSSAADRVLIETLKWAAGKANPAEYGDRQTVEHQGAQTLQVKIVEDDVPVKNVLALNDTAKEVVSGAIMQIAVQTPLRIAGGED